MKLQDKKILVIGGAGFIGSHIVDQLLKTNVKEVVIFDNLSRGKKEHIKLALKDPRCHIFEEGNDILYRDSLDHAMENVDGVFHLAAAWLLQCHEFPEKAFAVNVKGTFNVIMSAIKNKVKKVVFSSSASVYGDAVTDYIREDHPYNNYTFYGANKIAGEHFFQSLGHRYNLDWLGLRYMNVYGPRQDYHGAYVSVIHKILDKLAQNEAPEIHGDGKQCYDFIYVEDVARANILAMQSEKSGKIYNVGRGIGTSLKELAEIIIKLKQSNQKILYKPTQESFVTKRIGCPKAALKDLGFEWSIDLDEGLKKLIKWRDLDSSKII